MHTNITAISAHEHVRRRPAMYIGSTDKKGFAYMLENALVDFTDLYQTDNFLGSIEFHHTHTTFEITGNLNPALTAKVLGPISNTNGYLYITAIAYLSSRFEAQLGHTTLVFINGRQVHEPPVFKHNPAAAISFVFTPDDTIFTQPVQHYDWLCQNMRSFAMLNRGMQLLIKDYRQPYLNQSYFNYPDGIKPLFDKTITEKHSGNLFSIYIDQPTGNYNYQLCIGFNRALWKDKPLSYANHTHTYEGGSLNDGVLQGVIKALKAYAANYPQRSYTFNAGHVRQGLTQVLAVRGPQLEWEGCTKAKLSVPVIKKKARQLVYTTLLNYLHQHPEHAEQFMSMFDKTDYTQTGRDLTHCTMHCIVAKSNEAVDV